MAKLTKDDVEKQALARVVSERKEAENRRRSEEDPLEKKWLELYKMYRVVTSGDQSYEGRASIVSAEGFAAVENATASAMQQLFPTGYRSFNLKAKAELWKDFAKVNTDLIASQLNDIGFYQKFIPFVRQGCIYGTAIAKVMWKNDTRRVLENDITEVDENGMITKVDSVAKDAAYDNPDFQCVDIFDFYIDPMATSIENASFCIEEVQKSFAELKALEKKKKKNDAGETETRGVYENVDKIKDFSRSEVNISEYKQERMQAAGMSVQTADENKDRYTLHERWGKIPLSWLTLDSKDKDEEVEGVITIANNSVVLRISENPFWHQEKPYIVVRHTAVDHELYGIGVLEPVLSLFHEINDTHNQVLDNRTMILNHMWKKDRTAGINSKQLKFRQFGVVECNDIKGLEPLMPIDVTRSGENMLLSLKTDFMDGTGIHKYAEGGGIRGANETATGITAIIQEGNKRLSLAIRNYEKDGIAKFVRLCYQMNQQFISAERAISVLGEKGLTWFTLRPEDIVGDYEFIANGSSFISNKMLQIQNITQFLNVVGDDPTINRMIIYKKVWELLGFENFDELEAQQPALQGMMPPQNGGGSSSIGGMPLESMQANQGGQYATNAEVTQ